ncbi:hypothetical protein EPUL_002917, partial [Erysiphe pulchra]
MSFQQELASWTPPAALPLLPAPKIGRKAYSHKKLLIPSLDGNPIIVSFLRHCGCPFAEKTAKDLDRFSTQYPNITFIVVSHSSRLATENWTRAIGGIENITVIVDEERELYASWGLGIASIWHVLNPWSLWNLWQIGKTENIWNRPTESGNRWQLSGSWAIDEAGIVRWGGVAKSADDIPDFEEAAKLLDNRKVERDEY